MSLRFKFVLALLSSSVASVAQVGGVAYFLLTDKFDSLRRKLASMHFKGAVIDYLTRYGGNRQVASVVMPFRQFMEQQGPTVGTRPRPPRPDGPPAGRPHGPPDERRVGPPDQGPPGAGPDGPRRGGEPPFKFILLDAQYRVLLGNGLSATLRQLTSAVKAMQGGALRQKVAVDSGGGQLATLATAFNQMSEELA